MQSIKSFDFNHPSLKGSLKDFSKFFVEENNEPFNPYVLSYCGNSFISKKDKNPNELNVLLEHKKETNLKVESCNKSKVARSFQPLLNKIQSVSKKPKYVQNNKLSKVFRQKINKIKNDFLKDSDDEDDFFNAPKQLIKGSSNLHRKQSRYGATSFIPSQLTQQQNSQKFFFDQQTKYNDKNIFLEKRSLNEMNVPDLRFSEFSFFKDQNKDLQNSGSSYASSKLLFKPKPTIQLEYLSQNTHLISAKPEVNHFKKVKLENENLKSKFVLVNNPKQSPEYVDQQFLSNLKQYSLPQHLKKPKFEAGSVNLKEAAVKKDLGIESPSPIEQIKQFVNFTKVQSFIIDPIKKTTHEDDELDWKYDFQQVDSLFYKKSNDDFQDNTFEKNPEINFMSELKESELTSKFVKQQAKQSSCFNMKSFYESSLFFDNSTKYVHYCEICDKWLTANALGGHNATKHKGESGQKFKKRKKITQMRKSKIDRKRKLSKFVYMNISK
jgi:hypothetical protein